MGTMIGQPKKEKIMQMVGALIGDHLDEINDAYAKTEDGLSIGFTVKIKPHPQAGNQIDAGINFVESRVKDTITDAVDEHQLMMFEIPDQGQAVGSE